jgi:hypothetical protein
LRWFSKDLHSISLLSLSSLLIQPGSLNSAIIKHDITDQKLQIEEVSMTQDKRVPIKFKKSLVLRSIHSTMKRNKINQS